VLLEAATFALFGADSSTCQVAALDSVDITLPDVATAGCGPGARR